MRSCQWCIVRVTCLNVGALFLVAVHVLFVEVRLADGIFRAALGKSNFKVYSGTLEPILRRVKIKLPFDNENS